MQKILFRLLYWFLLLPESRRGPFILRLRVTVSVDVRTIDGVDVATKSNRVERSDDDDTDEDARTRIIRGCANRLMRLLIRLALLLLINDSLIMLVRGVPADESIPMVNG